MNSASIVTTYKNEAGTVTIKTDTLAGDLSINLEREEISAGAVNTEFDLAIDVSAVLAFGIGCKKTIGESADKTVELVIKTNSTSSPGDTLTITPTNGIGWSSGDSADNPLSVDVTKIYVTNNGTAKANLFVRALVDSSPVLPD